jgi:hypothetical protein
MSTITLGRILSQEYEGIHIFADTAYAERKFDGDLDASSYFSDVNRGDAACLMSCCW